MGEFRDPKRPVESVAPERLREEIAAGESMSLLDVRNRDEIERWKIDGDGVERTEIPYVRFVEAEVTDRVDELAADLNGPVTVVCGRGEASAYVASLLEGVGVEARNLDGGMNRWARLYDATAVDHGGETTVVQYERPSSGCLGYLLVSGDEAAVVDPLWAFADRYAADAEARGATLVAALDTHIHADHVSGVRRVAAETGAEPMLPEHAVERGVTFDVTPIEDGQQVELGTTTVEAVPLPGHTTDMTGYAVDGARTDASGSAGALLTGDSLFVDGVARPDLEADAEDVTAYARDLHRTLTERLTRFDDGVLVAPGHASDDPTRAPDGTVTARLGDLRDRRPAFGRTEESFVESITAHAPPRPANHERIVAINLGAETADEEETFELELGPNNCAAGGDEG